MKLRIEGRTVDAKIDPWFADTRIGHAVILLNGKVVVEPGFAALHDYQIVEATRSERQTLEQAGYELADYQNA